MIKSQIAPRLANYVKLTIDSTPKYFDSCGATSLNNSITANANFKGNTICDGVNTNCPAYNSGWSWGQTIAETLIFESSNDNRTNCQSEGVEGCVFNVLQNLVDDSGKAKTYGMHWLSGSCDTVPLMFLITEAVTYVATTAALIAFVRNQVKKRNLVHKVIDMEPLENFL